MFLETSLICLDLVMFLFCLESQTGETFDQLAAKSVTAVPGSRVILPCRVSHNMNVLWRNEEAIIHNNGRIRSNFTRRYSLGSTQDTYHALIISDSEPSDSGIYECIENNGSGRSHYVFLLVAGTSFT